MRFQQLACVFLAACTSPVADPVDPAPRATPVAVPAGRAPDVAARLLGARADLELASTHTSLAGEHVRYRRLAADGTRIVDHEVSVHLDGGHGAWARAKVLDDHPQPFALVGQRSITEATAEARAREAITEGRIERVTVERVALPSPGDRDVVRAGYRAMVETREPAHGWEVWIDGDGTAEVIRDRYQFVDGTGFVYDPNPLAQTGDMALVDGNDATTPALDAARFAVTLPRLDGTGVLRGMYADVQQRATRAQSANHAFAYTRDDDRFEEVNVYYHLDAAQAKLQALGFTNVNNRVQIATVNDGNQDNSFYSPSSKEVSFGAGGVDDAEDGDIVVHEYGHSVQDNIVPGYGTSHEAGAMGEGFGDLLAASLGPMDAAHTQVLSRACVGAWDATSYDDANPPCLRRIDTTKHWPESANGSVHDDGQIWSSAMWDLYTTLGDPRLGLQLVIEAFFRVAPNTKFADYSTALIDADIAVNAGANVDKIEKVLWARGLYRVPAPPVGFDGPPSQMTVDLGTPSPIGDRADASLTVTQPGAGAVRVHFSAFDMDTDPQCLGSQCDNVYIFDGNGTLYGILGGALGPSDSPVVPGDTMVLRWVTDRSTRSTGFRIDRVEFGMAGSASDGAVPVVDAGVMVGPEAGMDPGKEGDDSGGCCDAGGRADASSFVGAFGLAWLLRRRRRAARQRARGLESDLVAPRGPRSRSRK